MGALFAAKYPNVIAFCGHAHQCAVNDQCVWQGAFTAIEVPSLRYCVTLGGRENGFSLFDRETRHIVRTMPEMGVGEGYDFTRQGYFVSIYDNCMVVKRHEFKYGVSLGPDWVIPLPSPGDRPYAFEARRKVVPAPQFPAGAAVTVKDPLEKGTATHSSILVWRIPMDRGAWWATVHWGRKESDMTEQLN